MKKSKSLLALLLVLCMMLSIVPAVSAEEAAPLATEDEVVIYYTNDVHTYIDKNTQYDRVTDTFASAEGLSYDNIADLKQKTAEITDTFLLDAGDHIQGTAYGSMDKGASIIQLMNAAGYDLATLGNHEFDYTMEGTMNAISWADFPYVSCNFYHEKDGVAGETVLDAYQVLTTSDGRKIAVIGITTPESFTKSTPAYFQDENGNYIYGIAGGTDGKALYDTVQKTIDEVKEEVNPDTIIALAHLGDDPSSAPWTSEEVIANTTGLDALIDGHSHSTVPMKEVKDKDGNTVILTQTGEYFNAIGRMSIAADGTITTSLIESYEGFDPDVKAAKESWIRKINEELGQTIGKAEVVFDNYDAEGNRLVRKQETNTGDFAADALYYLFDNMGLDVDVAIMNGGGVRNKAITGDLSYFSCKDIHTFGNVACLQTVTGQQLLDALEWGVSNYPGEGGGFLHVSGLTYEIHTYISNGCISNEKKVWTGHEGLYRVQNVKILQDGEYVDLDLNAKYNLAGYNYTLRDLGDGFAMFDGAVNVLDYVMEDYLVLANYIKSFENGVIPADSIYADVNGNGRITFVDDAPVVIYYTNDVHTYIDKNLSYANIADLKQKTAEITDTFLLDAGDHIQGTAYGSMDKGESIIRMMAEAGYDLATLGNHEFDYTMEGTMDVISWAPFPYVSCNFYHEKDGIVGDTVLSPYHVFVTSDDRKIAVIGITTPESFTKSTPAYFQDEDGNYIYGIAGGTDGKELYDTVQKTIDEVQEEFNPDTIIALAHLGDDPSSAPWTSEEVIANTTGLDALIDGHSHSTVPMKEVKDKDGNTVILTQTGEYFNAIGRMSIAADGTITTSLITEYAGEDAGVKALVDDWKDSVDEQLGEVIGKAEVTFDNYDEEGNRLVRKQETNTGDFAADALYYLFDNMGLDVDVAIMNGGGVRNKAITGDISYKTCKDIHTFGNVACLQTITGQQLLDALEWGLNKYPGEGGGFLHVSGLTYEIHTYIANGCISDEKNVWLGHKGQYRVQNVKILQDGEYVDLDLNAKYNLAGYNYTLRDLGDGFAMFDGAVNVLDYVMEDYLVLANYIKSFENGVIPADSIYADVNGNGRITFVDDVMKALDKFTDVDETSYYAQPLAFMVSQNVINGMTETTFAPKVELERRMLVTMLYRLAGSPDVSGMLAHPFTDVAEDAYCADALTWAYSCGIVKGRTETTFDPTALVTREELAVMLHRAAKEPKVEGELSAFVDGDDYMEYAEEALLWATQTGLIKGNSVNGTLYLQAGKGTERCQAVTVLYRFSQR